MASRGLSPAISRLFDAIRRINDALALAGDGASALATVNLHRVSSVVAALDQLSVNAVARLPADQLERAISTADRLAATLEGLLSSASRETDLGLAAYLSDQLMEMVGYVALAPQLLSGSRDEASRGAGSESPQSVPSEGLITLAAGYAEDAKLERTTTLLLYGAALMLVAAALSLGLLGIARARDGDPFDFAEFSAHGLVALVVLGCAAVVSSRAGRHSLAAQEACRLARQLAGFEAYVAPMPPALRHLVRGTMVQRLFPRLLEDDEPWREPKWPDTASLMTAINEPREGSPTDTDGIN